MNNYEIPKFQTKQEQTDFFRDFISNINPGCYVISSTYPHVGKTTLIKNLTNALIEQNITVLIINSDFMNKKVDFSDMSCDVRTLTEDECNFESINSIINEAEHNYVFIDTSPLKVETSIMNISRDVLNICDGYLYVINEDMRLVDQDCTDVILYHLTRRPLFASRIHRL